jgi:hypothetical protein
VRMHAFGGEVYAKDHLVGLLLQVVRGLEVDVRCSPGGSGHGALAFGWWAVGKTRKANQLTGITTPVERGELRMSGAFVCVNL